MPHLPWYVWVLGTLAAYFVVSLALDAMCRGLFARRSIGGAGRAPIRLARRKVATLFVLNTLQIGAALALADGFHEQGRGGLYVQEIASPLQLLLVAAQTLFILFVFDTNFFWVHRFAHRHRRLFAMFHAEHHRPRFPTVWHLQYQHPLDYLATTAAPLVWVALLPIPLSTQSYLLAVTIAAFHNIAGHAGHEVSDTFIGLPTPNGWAAALDPRRRWLARLFNNVLHHDLHHQKCRGNYSLYFTFWDRLCGTLNPDTDRVDVYVRERGVT
ncbi:sterol desaturase family protein [Nannocystis radixulma]|uniref:Sterol desaturase family protein n=1 Tax=Nannocystis radixulma TaxID=2995305 RepID=A0ABT5BEA8_9BACT|nr:sterol desaturase family protein [Nannocystis radixulma]MDC0672478.1 sterol desaturase family protein [Nannocystis radixulma]